MTSIDRPCSLARAFSPLTADLLMEKPVPPAPPLWAFTRGPALPAQTLLLACPMRIQRAARPRAISAKPHGSTRQGSARARTREPRKTASARRALGLKLLLAFAAHRAPSAGLP